MVVAVYIDIWFYTFQQISFVKATNYYKWEISYHVKQASKYFITFHQMDGLKWCSQTFQSQSMRFWALLISLSLSRHTLSLSHTHTHTYTHTLRLIRVKRISYFSISWFMILSISGMSQLPKSQLHCQNFEQLRSIETKTNNLRLIQSRLKLEPGIFQVRSASSELHLCDKNKLQVKLNLQPKIWLKWGR